MPVEFTGQFGRRGAVTIALHVPRRVMKLRTVNSFPDLRSWRIYSDFDWIWASLTWKYVAQNAREN